MIKKNQKSVFILIVILIISGNSFAQKKKIAYCSNNTSSGIIQIFVMNDDGSDKRQLTDVSDNCMKPNWSPDGKQIVFYTAAGQNFLIRNVDSANEIKDPYFIGNGYNPDFLPTGYEIIYNDDYDGILSIFIIDTTTGSEPAVISDGRYSNMQSVSDDGDQIIYSGFVDNTKSIMMADLNDTSDDYIKKISQNKEANLEPDISPDESKIVYSSFDNNLKGTIRIYENGNETALSKGLPSSNVPRFSPDGNKIAFVVIDGNDVSLYTMNDDGSEKRNLNLPGGNVGTFQWLDNDRIVYDAGSETKTSIGVINTGTGESKIIAEGGFNLQPDVLQSK